MRIVTFGFILLLVFGIDVGERATTAQTALAQFKSRLTLQNAGKNAGLTVHRSAFGKPCLDIEAASRAHVINPDVYDNVVSVKNQCSKRISVRICYFNTKSCVDVDVPGHQRKDAIIGVRPHMQYFRYSFREKF